MLTVQPELKAELLSGTELWLRLELHNIFGLPSKLSNSIYQIKVTLTMGRVVCGTDLQGKSRQAWGQLRSNTDWVDISLDAADPYERRVPHDYEDVDGWLRTPGEFGCLSPDKIETLPIPQVYGQKQRNGLSGTNKRVRSECFASCLFVDLPFPEMSSH